MRVEIPVNDLIQKLKINKFVITNSKNLPQATARKDLVNFSHGEIIDFYNHRIQGLLAFYSFASNRTSLRKILMFLQLSCALTLALKLKLRTKRAIFARYGKTLKDPDTDKQLKIPSNLKVQHVFYGNKSITPEENLKRSLFVKLTKSPLNQKCTICQSKHKIEMHHIRKVKDIRGKIKTGNSTYAQ